MHHSKVTDYDNEQAKILPFQQRHGVHAMAIEELRPVRQSHVRQF